VLQKTKGKRSTVSTL